MGPPYYFLNPRELQWKHRASGPLFAGTWYQGVLKTVGWPRHFVGRLEVFELLVLCKKILSPDWAVCQLMLAA